VSPRSGAESRRPTVWFELHRHDRHVLVTVFGCLGAVIAATMALAGLPPVDLHGPLHAHGIMDPLCGGTRAARLTAQGDLATAWAYNPLGILSVLGATAVAFRTILGLVSGRWLNAYARLTPNQLRWVAFTAVVLLVALDVRQQLRSDLLMAGT